MREIPLTQGFVVLVDDEDYDWLNQYLWHYSKPYARRDSWDGQKQHHIYMHIEILNQMGLISNCGDHKDQDPLNNQRYNLREDSKTENNRNARLRKDNLTGYKGVGWSASHGLYRARIRVNKVEKHLGLFTDPREAALAYDRAARRYFGAFASLNFPETSIEGHPETEV